MVENKSIIYSEFVAKFCQRCRRRFMRAISVTDKVRFVRNGHKKLAEIYEVMRAKFKILVEAENHTTAEAVKILAAQMRYSTHRVKQIVGIYKSPKK